MKSFEGNDLPLLEYHCRQVGVQYVRMSLHCNIVVKVTVRSVSLKDSLGYMISILQPLLHLNDATATDG